MRAAGFSLIEVLVALLVLAIGLLGLAALQAQGLRFSVDSYARSQATTLAYDIIDQIRANRTNAATYAQNLTPLMPPPGGVAVCTPATASVNNDLTCWLAQVQAALPGVVPSIAVNPTDANYLDITLSWIDRDPREFITGASEARLPANQNECLFPAGNTGLTQLDNKMWDATNNVCLIAQTWTVFP